MNERDGRADRVAGLLIGMAVGDALGVPYEFAARISQEPEMLGGGLGDYEPGEYSDDTQMAVCIARVAAGGLSLTDEAGLDAIADRFIGWLNGGATDVGIQTRSILTGAQPGPGSAGRLRERGDRLHAETGRTAGNGALMRTAVVALPTADDRVATARAAQAVARLTHPDPLAIESCMLWTEAARLAVTEGRIDPLAGLDLLPEDRQAGWRAWLDTATGANPGSFPNNGFTVAALQAAWAAISSTASPDPEAHIRAALTAAVQAGNDTDTVAAIAGALLGAAYGFEAIPAAWREAVHGWPGLASSDLVSLARQAAGF